MLMKNNRTRNEKDGKTMTSIVRSNKNREEKKAQEITVIVGWNKEMEFRQRFSVISLSTKVLNTCISMLICIRIDNDSESLLLFVGFLCYLERNKKRKWKQ